VRRIFVTGGFADVTGDLCALLAEEAVNIGDLDAAGLEQHLSNLQDDLGFAKGDLARSAHIQKDIEITRAKIDAVKQAA
jgi:F-type H+-transporting ATPase subunit epsilon